MRTATLCRNEPTRSWKGARCHHDGATSTGRLGGCRHHGDLDAQSETLTLKLRLEWAAAEQRIRGDMASMEMGIRGDMASMEKNLRSDMASMQQGHSGDMASMEETRSPSFGSASRPGSGSFQNRIVVIVVSLVGALAAIVGAMAAFLA